MSYLFQTFHELFDNQSNECLITKLGEETAQIIKAIDQKLFEIESRQQAEFYVQKVELAIANFESSIQTALRINDSISRKKLLEFSLECLDGIRFHLECTYSIYRDDRKPVSKKTLHEISGNLKMKTDTLRMLFEKNEIDEKLKNLIFHSIQNITHHNGVEVTHQRIEYIKIFLDELILFIESLNEVDEQQLLRYLYMLNFNSVAMLSYICEHYKRMKDKIEDEKSLLVHLNKCRSQLNSMPQSVRKPYNTDLDDLIVQVQTWIQEEIVYVKKSIKKKAKEHEKIDGKKLKFNQSLDVITCFFRLLRDAEITDLGANQTILWIEQNISSKNQPHISKQSIQRKFYEKYPNKKPIKDLLTHLLQYVNEK